MTLNEATGAVLTFSAFLLFITTFYISESFDDIDDLVIAQTATSYISAALLWFGIYYLTKKAEDTDSIGDIEEESDDNEENGKTPLKHNIDHF